MVLVHMGLMMYRGIYNYTNNRDHNLDKYSEVQGIYKDSALYIYKGIGQGYVA